MNTANDIRDYLNSIDITDTKNYAKALLEVETTCWEIDPILIDELWTVEIHNFLRFLTKEN